MDAAQLGFEILKVFPYVVAAGLVGAAVAAAYQRSAAGGAAHASRVARVGDAVPGWQATVGWGRRQWRRVTRRLHFSAVQVGLGCALAAALLAAPSVWRTPQREAAAATAAALGPVPLRPLAGVDGGLRFGAVSAADVAGGGEPSEASALAWLFGALVSGGRAAEAYALLSPEAQRTTPADAFAAQLERASLLRGSDDTPWRIPGSDVFLFSVSDRSNAAALTGELRIGLARVDGEWRIASFNLHDGRPAAAEAARRKR